MWISGIPLVFPFRQWGVEVLLLLLCWDFQRFRLGFQVRFIWQTLFTTFFAFLSFPHLSKLFSPEKVVLLFKSLLAGWPSLRFYFCLLGIFRFQRKEMYSSYLNLWEFILRIDLSAMWCLTYGASLCPGLAALGALCWALPSPSSFPVAPQAPPKEECRFQVCRKLANWTVYVAPESLQ